MTDWELRLGDCLDPVTGLASLADKSVDHVITDPPYSEHVHQKSRRGLSGTHRPDGKNEISERRELGFEPITLEQMQATIVQLARLTERWALIFSDIESSSLWRTGFAAIEHLTKIEYVRTCAWVKVNGAPQFTGDRPAVGFEAVNAFHGKAKRWNGGGKPGVYSFPIAMDRDRSGRDRRVHTAQKPLALMEALIRDFTDPGELVIDPFAGSGTTGVACRRLGRRFLGWEINAKYHDIACKRIERAREQLGLAGIGA